MKWHIGCSGFSYKEWKDFFYPPKTPQRLWLEYYATQFNCVELNVTFYRFPKKEFLQQLQQRTPDHFLFAVKAPRDITHYRRFNNTQALLDDFYAAAEDGLQHKLGPVLFQLPPSLQYSEALLQNIVAQLNSNFANVLEFRHASWWNDTVRKQLQEHNIIFCGINYPNLTIDAIADTATCYYRFHGAPKLYYSSYDNETLDAAFNTIKASPTVKDAFIFFNNTATEAAINNARYLLAKV